MKRYKSQSILKAATYVAIASGLTLCMTAAAFADAITKPMSWTPPSGMEPGPIEETSAVLEKGSFGAAMAIKSSGLTPGHVVTIWWVAIQNHQNCKANPCSPQDAMGNPLENDVVLKLAVGGVVAEDGTVSLASFLPKGDVDGNLNDTTLHSPEAAEYHLAMHNHGPLNANIAQDMLNSFRAGCSDESLPAFYPDTAIQDGVKGSFDCKTVQVALFPMEQ